MILENKVAVIYGAGGGIGGAIEFEFEDPAFARAMTMTRTLTAFRGVTQVSIRCENVPEGIRPEDHEAGFSSTLENLRCSASTVTRDAQMRPASP